MKNGSCFDFLLFRVEVIVVIPVDVRIEAVQHLNLVMAGGALHIDTPNREPVNRLFTAVVVTRSLHPYVPGVPWNLYGDHTHRN
jgi:hypothetical protein